MDRPQDKRRVTLSYVAAAIILVIVVVLSQVYTNYRVNKRQAEAAETSDAAEMQTEESTAQAEPDTAEKEEVYAPLTVDSSIYDVYRYRTVTDEAELAFLGLPTSIKEEDLGGKFATAENQVVLYAYPRYGCRAVLVGNNSDKYSFCVLDGFTDDGKFGLLSQIPPLYGVNTASDVTSAALISTDGTAVPLDQNTVEQMLTLFDDCSNNNAGTNVNDGISISMTLRTGLPLELRFSQDLSVISVLGESYKATAELKALLSGYLS